MTDITSSPVRVAHPAPARATAASAAGRAPAVDADTSRTIVTARVLCISTMMLVHVWPGAGTILEANAGSPLGPLYEVILNDLARSSVPLLGAVSGFLLWIALERGRTFGSVVAGKARALLLPMVLWSVALLVLHLGESMTGGDPGFLRASPLEWANRVFALTAAPINIPLGFLRDVFLCCAASAALLAATRSARQAVALLFVWAWVELILGGLVLLRPQIAVLFSLGAALALVRPRSFAVSWAAVAAACVADFAFALTQMHDDLLAFNSELATLPHRLTMALVFWRISWSVSRWPLPWRAWESRIFLVFCSHMVVVSLLAVVFAKAGIDLASPAYLALFVGQLPLIFLGAEAIRQGGQRWAPGLIAAATGGRAGR